MPYIRYMKLSNFILVLIAAIFLWGSPANARQDDPRLEELFSALSETENFAEGKVIERSIWTIWLTSGSDTTDFLMAQGMNYMSQGAFAKSLTLFTSITKIDPGYSEAWNKRATVLFLMGEFDASVEDIERTLELEPRHFGALSGLGQIYDRQDINASAISAFQKAVSLNPHMPGVKERMKQLKKEQNDKKI